MKKSRVLHIIVLTSLIAILFGITTEVKIWLIDQVDTLKEENPCWFLTPPTENVLVNDLAMWTEHLDHNPNAHMSEWFDLRVTELVELYSSEDITLTESALCLDSLAAVLAEKEIP